jgi:poly(A) polymerase
MARYERGPGPWIKPVKQYLENEVVEGRLAQDDVETAYELADAYVRKHDLFEEAG